VVVGEQHKQRQVREEHGGVDASMSMSARMSSGFQPGVVPSWPWNWRYLDTVQPSKPIVCSFLNSV
jgi:hypothetical protein